jgi:hypothetical protein
VARWEAGRGQAGGGPRSGGAGLGACGGAGRSHSAGTRNRLRIRPAVVAVRQRGEHVQPRRPAVTAKVYRAAGAYPAAGAYRADGADRAVRSGDLGSGSWASAIARRGCDRGWCGVTAGIWLGAGCLGPGRTVTLLAGRAHQPVESIHTPARSQCPCPVVRFAQRSQVGELRPAANDVTASSGQSELITDDTVFGNRQRIKQRVMAGRGRFGVRRRMRGHPPGVRWRARQPSLGHPARPASYRRSAGPAPRRERPGVPRQCLRAHLPLPHPVPCGTARQWRTTPTG